MGLAVGVEELGDVGDVDRLGLMKQTQGERQHRLKREMLSDLRSTHSSSTGDEDVGLVSKVGVVSELGTVVDGLAS